MAIIKIPKTAGWILICALLLLLLLSGYRFAIYQFFPEVFSGVSRDAGSAFLMGLRFDARLVAIISLLMILLSFWPGMHFFKWALGKHTALVLYGLAITIVMMGCIADVAYLQHFHMRLQGSLISDLAKNTDKWQGYRSKSPWVLLFMCMFVVVTIFIILISQLHQLISKSKMKVNRQTRRVWQICTIIGYFVIIYGQVGLHPLLVSRVADEVQEPVLQLAMNPFESLCYSLPAVTKKPASAEK